MDDKRTFNEAVGTAKVGAGMIVGDILTAAADQNLTLITGSDLTVGIAGFFTSGGHGPVTSRFGLAADQVVEMEVVTAKGELLTINQESQPDLFWAMRGVRPPLSLSPLPPTNPHLLTSPTNPP